MLGNYNERFYTSNLYIYQYISTCKLISMHTCITVSCQHYMHCVPYSFLIATMKQKQAKHTDCVTRAFISGVDYAAC